MPGNRIPVNLASSPVYFVRSGFIAALDTDVSIV
jgi:hypothetical protein